MKYFRRIFHRFFVLFRYKLKSFHCYKFTSYFEKLTACRKCIILAKNYCIMNSSSKEKEFFIMKVFNRNFVMVLIGQIISLFGNTILRFALPLYLLYRICLIPKLLPPAIRQSNIHPVNEFHPRILHQCFQMEPFERDK